MVQQQFEVLELRITQMVEQMKKLRLDHVRLQSIVDKQEKICKTQSEERRIASRRISKVLETLNRFSVKGDDEKW